MRGVNKVILVGTVGKNPEVHYLDEGMPCARFSLATDEYYTDKNGEKIKVTEWHNIVFWRKLAEIVEMYVKKGTSLYIEGKIQSRSYDDKQGKKVYIYEIVGNNLVFLSPQPNKDEVQEEEKSEISELQINELKIKEADELPF